MKKINIAFWFLVISYRIIKCFLSYWEIFIAFTFNTTENIKSMIFLSHHVQRNQGHKAWNLHQKIHNQRHARIQGKCSDSRHVWERAKEETRGFRHWGEKHGWGNFANNSADMFSVGFVAFPLVTLICLIIL